MSNFITKLFSFRKTMAAANAPPVSKLEKTGVKQAPAPKQRKILLAEKRKNNKSIFSRIASPFKAIRAWAKIRPIRKQIKNKSTNLKIIMPLKLKNLLKKREAQEISRNYSRYFHTLIGTFTDENGLTPPKDESAEMLSEHLTNFCGDDKNQASALSVLLTQEASKEISKQLQASSPELHNRETGINDIKIDVLMMRNNTARIVFTQDYNSLDWSRSDRIITVKTTIDMPRQDPSSITLNSVNITPKSK